MRLKQESRKHQFGVNTDQQVIIKLGVRLRRSINFPIKEAG